MTTELSTKVCTRGHVGQYFIQTSGWLRCRECAREDGRKTIARRKAQGLTANGTPPVFGPPEERFWKYVTKGEGCWVFSYSNGVVRKYGNFFVSPARRNVLPHRYSYEISVGPIPEGLTIDHLCGVTQCVRPDHLEPVTLAENLRRAHAHGDECKNGHNYVEAGHFFTNQGWIVCKQCRKDSRAKSQIGKR